MWQVSAHHGLTEVLLVYGIKGEGIYVSAVGSSLCIGGKDAAAHGHNESQCFHTCLKS